MESNAADEPDFEIDTEAFIQSMRNPNTVRKTNNDIKKFTVFLRSTQNEMRAPEEITVSELDNYLARFFMVTKKNDGTEYEPDTFKQFQCSVNRYLAEKKALVNIIEDKEFKHSRDVLLSKRKQLRQMGKGNRPNTAEPFTKEEIQILYEKNYLGTANPRALIHTLFLNNTLHFGMRTRLEHVELKWGDIELKTDSHGGEYLVHTERATKTRTGQTSDSRPFQPKMFASPGNSRFPVAAYTLFESKRPTDMMKPESPFYIGINKQCASSGVWYINKAMGKNTIGSIVKDMCTEAGITGRKVNHSARKTGITSLMHAGVQNTVVMQLSGHTNVNSINNYSTASVNQQKEMSSILTNYSGNDHSTVTHKETNMSTVSIAQIPADEQFQIPEDNKDQALMRASQEIVEETLKSIENFESCQLRNIDTHPVQSPPFSKFSPQNLLTGATVNGNITFNFGFDMFDKENTCVSSVKKTKRKYVIESDSD